MKVECEIEGCENNRNGRCGADEIRIGYAGCLSIRKQFLVSTLNSYFCILIYDTKLWKLSIKIENT